jgi:arylsulfatase A-like enzyme
MGKWHLGDDVIGNAGWDAKSSRGDEQTTAAALSFMAEHAGGEKPLFMFLMYNDPHDIYYFQNRPDRDPERYGEAVLGASWYEEDLAVKPWPQLAFMQDNQGQIIHGMDEDEWQYYRDYYRRQVTLFDNQVGRIVAGLKTNGMWENTIVLVSSDHGDMDTFHKLVFKGPFMYEHLIRVPALVRVPSGVGGGAPYVEREHDWVNVDIMPTVLELAGLDVPEVDGISYAPLLTGGVQGAAREFVVTQYYGKQQWVNPIRSIRTHDFKYNLYVQFGEELYDLKNDPDEIVNLATDTTYADVMADLRSKLDTWIADNDDPFHTLTVTEMQSPGPIIGRVNR